MDMVPKFLQGVFSFEGAGLDQPVPLDADLAYAAPADKRAQLIYLRAGNSSPELICLSLMRDGALMRLFPIGAKADSHVSLAVVEDLAPETRLEVFIAAPAGAAGTVVLDIGLMEI
jgi:assimilatory nitrate reductase catalytic subunit